MTENPHSIPALLENPQWRVHEHPGAKGTIYFHEISQECEDCLTRDEYARQVIVPAILSGGVN